MMKTDELATDVGSVLDGTVAVKSGLIDNIGDISMAIDKLYKMIEQGEKKKKKTK